MRRHHRADARMASIMTLDDAFKRTQASGSAVGAALEE